MSWKEILNWHVKGFGQENDFSISDAANLCLDFSDGVLPHVPTHPRTAGGKHGLGQATTIPELSYHRTNQVLGWGLAHRQGLTIRASKLGFLPNSE